MSNRRRSAHARAVRREGRRRKAERAGEFGVRQDIEIVFLLPGQECPYCEPGTVHDLVNPPQPKVRNIARRLGA